MGLGHPVCLGMAENRLNSGSKILKKICSRFLQALAIKILFKVYFLF